MEGKITTIAEHSVCLDILPPKSTILDVGCRGFLFTNEMRRLGHIAVPVDMDDLGPENIYYQCAIAGYDGRAGILKNSDPQATRITQGSDVACYKLDTFIKKLGVEFDLIKLDAEGAEYEIIMSLEKAPAKQLSVEFHMHCGITQDMMKEMEHKLFYELGYNFASHELTEQHGCGYNYWDSLFIKR